jgi:GLPGLI family protein
LISQLQLQRGKKLEGPGQGGGRWMSSMTGGGKLIKNVKEKLYAVDKEFMGKEFGKGFVSKLSMEIEGETRVIGGYNCFKATTVRPASKTDFRNFRPKEDPAAAKSAEGERKQISWII